MDYLEAIDSILKGNPVDNLEALRQEYNKKFYNFYSFLPKRYKKTSTYDQLELVSVSFVADRENKILKGEEHPVNSYLGFHSDSFEFRNRGRQILEGWKDSSPINIFLRKMKNKEKTQGHYIKNFSYN